MEDPDFFRDLFRQFRSSAPASEAQADIVSFLQELTNLSKTLPPQQRASLLQKLVNLGLFEATTPPPPQPFPSDVTFGIGEAPPHFIG